MNKKTISIMLCVFILVLSLSFSHFAVNKGSGEDIIQNAGNTKFIKGSELFSTDFSEYETGNLPDGFSLAVPSFSENKNENLKAIINKSEKKSVLTLTSDKSDAFLTFPQINTQDYI